MAVRSILAPALAWRSAKRLWSGTVAVCGWSLNREQVPPFISPFRMKEGITMNPIRAIDILLVEDSPADVRLTREALKEAKVLNTLHVVPDGEVAMAFLLKQGQYAGGPSPDLILLDLNLPKKDGRQVLAEIKEDENLKRIPVVVLTTSRAEEDVVRTYNLHANAYVTKPVDLTQFLEVIRTIEAFWLAVVTLPPSAKAEADGP